MKKIIPAILALSIAMIPFQTVYAENSADSSLSAEENFIPSDWQSAFDFLIDNGANSETNGRQLVEVIPVARSEDFIIEDSPETDEVKPYTVETYTYYYYDDSEENSIGYRVRIYTIRDGVQVSDGYTLNHTTKTTYIYDSQKKSDIYKLNYYIDPVTMTFRKLSIIPQNYREAGSFERKYGTFAIEENTKQVVAVVHANNNNMNQNGCIYEPFVTHEIKGTAKMTSSQTFSRDHYIKLYSGEGIISSDSGNEVITFDASEKGDYTIRIKLLLMGDPYYYNVNYSVDDDGKITLGETFNYPDTIECDDDAETLFKGKNLYQGNSGFLINQGDTIQIALPKDDYRISYKNPSVFGSERLINTEKFSKYMVYTYNLEPIPPVNDVAANIPDGDFEIKFISDDDFYTYRFSCNGGIIENRGFVNKFSGDANNDGLVDIADIVAVSAYIGDSKENRLSAKAMLYCDVQNYGDGITSGDLLMIQQYLTKIITEF